MLQRLQYFPISFFSIILGLFGLSIALEKMGSLIGTPPQVAYGVLFTSSFLFLIIFFSYCLKIFLFPSLAKKELFHPIKINFFPTFSISLLLLSIALLPLNIDFSRYFWILGTLFHAIFTFFVISFWIQKRDLEIHTMNPSWFIPAVGNILIPLAGVEHFSGDISWFFFSVGFFFWIILLVIFFNRILFHNPLPDKLLPTLAILIAPPAIGCIALIKLLGEVSIFSMMLYHFALFLAFLVLFQLPFFLKIRFYLSWWAYSFPIAAITIASLSVYQETQKMFFFFIALFFLFSLVSIILLLLQRTFRAIQEKEICIEE